MSKQFLRTESLIGKEGLSKLQNSKVAVFGIGGVGSYVVEALARVGIGSFVLIDNDEVSITNLNRQLIAVTSTIGKPKVDVEENRIKEINPNANVEIYKEFFSYDTKSILNDSITYIVDAIDTVSSKIELIVSANQMNIPIISCMGTGNKIDPTKLEISDIYKTSVCPLAKVMRKSLRQKNIRKLKVVYSKEEPIKPKINLELKNNTTQVPGSVSYVPAVAGLFMASEVVKDIISFY